MGISGSQQALMECRAGVARSQATRLGYYSLDVYLSIGGTSRRDDADLQTMIFVERLNEGTDELEFTLESGSAPTEGNEVTMAWGAADKLVFGGTLTNVGLKSVVGLSGCKAWRCKALDWSYLLSAKLVRGARYTSSSLSAIVTDLVDTYAPEFTANVEAGSPTLSEFVVSYGEPLTQALSRAVEQAGVNWSWRPEPDKTIKVFQGQAQTQNPPQWTENAAGNAVGDFEDLNYERSGDQIRNRVIVLGRKMQVADAAAVTAADTTITLVDASEASAGGGTILIGTDEVTYTGKSGNDLTGIPASGAGSISRNYPAGQEVRIVVIRNDSAAQTQRATDEGIGGDGVHEILLDESDLGISACEAVADAALGIFADRIEEVTWETDNRFARVGAKQDIDLPNSYGLVAVVNIQEIRATVKEEAKLAWKREVLAAPTVLSLSRLIGDLKRRVNK